uniref:Uncharacterized protein n=1 Tax=Lepeophtheirus salmonis TaxID=72036 RepID=A0A0K2TBF8_LEPSM
MRSPSKHVIRPSPGELERKLEEEHARRRIERLSQARSQSYSWGRDVARNSKSLCEKECRRNSKNMSRHRINEKLMKLEVLESQESAFLANVGLGRDKALNEIELGNEKACMSRQYRSKAQIRGSAALEQEVNTRKLSDLLSKKQTDMKKTALLNEKLRSQRVIKKKNTNFLEYDASKSTLTSKLVPQSEIVSSDKENIVIIHNSFSSSKCNGYDQAQKEFSSAPPPLPRPVIHSKDSFRLKKLQQEIAMKVKRAKEEFMNLEESTSVTQDKNYPPIDTRVIREYPLDTGDLPDGNIHDNDGIYEDLNQIGFEFPIKEKEKKVPKLPKEDTVSSSTLTPSENMSDSSSGCPLPMIRDNIKDPKSENNSPFDVIKINIAETSSSTLESSHDQHSIASKVFEDSSTASSTLFTSTSDPIADQLREYIDKCLNMKREELNELSSLTHSYLDNSSSVNTTPPTSILSCKSNKKLVKKRPKSVRFSSSTSTTDEEDSRIEMHPKKLSNDPRIHSQLDSISEGFLSISDSSKEVITPLSSKIISLKDKIFNMEIPVLPKRTLIHPEKFESSSTFVSSSIFFSTDIDEKVSRNNSLENDDNHSSITSCYLSSY